MDDRDKRIADLEVRLRKTEMNLRTAVAEAWRLNAALSERGGRPVYLIGSHDEGWKDTTYDTYHFCRDENRRVLYLPYRDHEITDLVNDLREVAIQYRDTQQLRARIHNLVLPRTPRFERDLAADHDQTETPA